MRVWFICVAWFLCVGVRAEFILTDTDVAQFKVIAEDTVTGEIILIEPAEGPSRFNRPEDGDVNAHVYLVMKTETGTRGLIVSRIGDVWLLADSELMRLERRRDRAAYWRKIRERALRKTADDDKTGNGESNDEHQQHNDTD